MVVTYIIFMFCLYLSAMHFTICQCLTTFSSTTQMCKLWIWEDLLNNYVDAMIRFFRDATIASLQAELQASQLSISDKQAQIARLEQQLQTLQKLIQQHPDEDRSPAQTSSLRLVYFLKVFCLLAFLAWLVKSACSV